MLFVARSPIGKAPSRRRRSEPRSHPSQATDEPLPGSRGFSSHEAVSQGVSHPVDGPSTMPNEAAIVARQLQPPPSAYTENWCSLTVSCQ